MRTLPMILATCMAALSCGCASAPVRYHSLLPATADSRTGTTALCCDVAITSVKIPPEVDRPGIVVRQSQDEMRVLGDDVWIASLRDEVKIALSSEIRRKLSDSGSLDSPHRVSLRVDVQRFESNPARYVLIQLAWRLTMSATPQEATAACESTARVDVGPGTAALVQGHQKALAHIADQIALAVLDLEKSGKTSCPADY